MRSSSMLPSLSDLRFTFQFLTGLQEPTFFTSNWFLLIMYSYLDLFNHCFTSNYIDLFLKPLNLRSFEIDFDNMVSKIFFLEMRKCKNQCWINCEFFSLKYHYYKYFHSCIFCFQSVSHFTCCLFQSYISQVL